jgi:two-component system NtrC family sensor kinase
MKTEPAALKLSKALSAEAFQAFFETLESPAAVCDTQLRLLAANPPFEVLCGIREVSGQNLGALLKGVASAVPPDGASSDVEVSLTSGQSMTLTLSRRGATVAVLARNLAQAALGGSLAAAGRALMEQARVEQALLTLGREVAVSTSEEELVAVVARGVKELFPGRTFCLRIADPRTGTLTSLYAEGQLRSGARDTLFVKRSAAHKTHLNVSALPVGRVQVVDGDLPLLFKDSVRGVGAPLVASGELFGALNVEYPEGITADVVADDRALTQLANHVAVGVRNAKLIDELTFVRKYLEELLEHANALIVVANRDRRVVVFNHQLSRLTGYEKPEVLGQDLLNFVPETERMRVMRVIAQSLKGEQVSNFETRVSNKDGNEVRVSFATSAVLAPDGDIEGVIAIGQDLTAVKEMERRVIHAEKLASLGQLAASVVHEINNPMTAIATYVDAMLARWVGQPTTDPSDEEKLKKVMENAKRIQRFTTDLVSYARPAKDKPEPTDVHKALDLAVTFCDHVLTQHRVAVERAYGQVPEFPAVKANLVQVFVNLITNACHAMKPGGKVLLQTTVEEAEAVVRIVDNGTGIDAKTREHIFEPFFTTKADGRGTGLGLSIVQQLVETHGGHISVDSRVDVGTTFVIRLPLTQ